MLRERERESSKNDQLTWSVCVFFLFSDFLCDHRMKSFVNVNEIALSYHCDLGFGYLVDSPYHLCCVSSSQKAREVEDPSMDPKLHLVQLEEKKPKHMIISKNHNSLDCKQSLGLHIKQSPNAQDAFHPIPGLISYAGVIRSVGKQWHRQYDRQR